MLKVQTKITMSSLNEAVPNPNEKFIFKCDQLGATISEQSLCFYQENEFFDTVLIAGTDRIEIQAHKFVLSALSEYLLELFRSNLKASKANNVVELKEIEPTTLKSIIDFMYSGWIELSLETAEVFLRAAAFLKIKTLIDGCNDFIEKQLTLSNCLYWYRLSQELALPGLKEKSLTFTYTNFEMVSKEKELLLLNENDLKDLLYNDNPYGDFEEDVFRSLVDWITYDKANREHLLFQMLSMVRFQYLTPKFIIENRRPVCQTVETYELICSWLQWHLSPETRSSDQQSCDLKPRKVEDKLAVIYSTNEKQDSVGIKTFDPKVNSWSLIKEITLVDGKKAYSMIVVDEKLIVVGGLIGCGIQKRVECLELHTLMWSDMPPMLNGRFCKHQVARSNGFLCVFDSTMEIYNFSTCKWYEVQYPSKPNQYSRIVFHNGIVHTLDFYNGCLQSYDFPSKQWTSKTIKRQELREFGLITVGRFLFVIGGYSGLTNSYVKTVMRYDLFKDSWCYVESLQHIQKDSKVKVCVFDNKIIISDGEWVQKYNPDTNKWITLCAFSEVDRTEFLLCSLPSKLF